ncbi:MAG TPA: hypothetical protein VN605_05520 [Thermoanaerobaculia bacterium]|nr:hypothetical protein [Thermoanaerobaculia bacterium]
MVALAPEIELDLGALLNELEEMGFEIVHARYDARAFGNYVVTLRGPSRELVLVRDRGQYFVEGSILELGPLGLWEAFDKKETFCERLLARLLGRGADVA